MFNVRSYAVITSSYWGFTLTDGALHMLVLCISTRLATRHLNLPLCSYLYEIMEIVTNLFGGWIGSRSGLKLTLYWGLGLQVFALWALSRLDPAWQ